MTYKVKSPHCKFPRQTGYMVVYPRITGYIVVFPLDYYQIVVLSQKTGYLVFPLKLSI